MERRVPKGYEGRQHETIGSDVLAVLRAIEHLRDLKSGPAPEELLGQDDARRLRAVDPDGWYPIAWMLELMEKLDGKLGRYGLRKMGRALFLLTHEERVKANVKSARELLHGMDGMYRHANRGEAIGGWRVLTFTSTEAELEKTTPHHCAMEEGIVAEALKAIGAPAQVAQSACFRDGAMACRFVVVRSEEGRWE